MRWSKILFTAMGIAIALSAIQLPEAIAENGELDRAFGVGGRVTVPLKSHRPWSQARVRLAQAPNGAVVVSGAGRLIRYLPTGEPDHGFGNDGVVTVELPGRLRFSLGDVAVDSENRTILVGSATHAGRSFAAVIRYDADGALDPFFGGDGFVITDFGLLTAPGQPAPNVTATLGHVDERGRITLVAGSIEPILKCDDRPHIGRRDRVIVRLTKIGVLDPTFGRHGIKPIAALQSVASMAFYRTGDAILAGVPRGGCRGRRTLGLLRLHEDGSEDRRFGGNGLRTLTGAAAAIAIDGQNRIVVLCQSRQLPRPRRDEGVTKIVRLLPEGGLDPSFSGGWVYYVFKGPMYKWSALAIAEDHPLLVGTLIRPLPQKDGQRFHRWFMVVPLHKSGRLTSGFSWRGWLAITRFNPQTDAAASDALLDSEGRLIIAGSSLDRRSVPPAASLTLARLELS